MIARGVATVVLPAGGGSNIDGITELQPRFRILFVCTGNVCRSPFAEILTRYLLTARLGDQADSMFKVRSAGAHALTGSSIHSETRAELGSWGLAEAADRFVARRLEVAQVEAADLVLGATPRHRSAAVRLVPDVRPRAFALREFARLIADLNAAPLPDRPFARANAIVGGAHRGRGLSALPGVDADEIPDPIGRGTDIHRAASDLIRAAVEAVVDLIAPWGVPGHSAPLDVGNFP